MIALTTYIRGASPGEAGYRKDSTMYEIGKTFRFAAAHHLPALPETHKCFREHGHNYEVDVVLRAGHLNGKFEWVEDYGALSGTIGAWIDANLDHRDLNEIYENPTAEVIAYELFAIAMNFGWGNRLHKIVVRETPNTWASYQR